MSAGFSQDICAFNTVWTAGTVLLYDVSCGVLLNAPTVLHSTAEKECDAATGDKIHVSSETYQITWMFC